MSAGNYPPAIRQFKSLLRAAYVLVVIAIVLIIWVYSSPLLIDNNTYPKTVWRPKSVQEDLPRGTEGDQIKYGYELITRTTELIGPLAKDPSMRFSGNGLTCNNCHLKAGRKIGAGSFIGILGRFPQFRARENKTGTLAERINGCMERSMNGVALPEGSKEMEAMISYMHWLSKDVPEKVAKRYKGYVKIVIPDFAADTLKGRTLFEAKCQLCHGERGKGKKNLEPTKGYMYPPLTGEDSYNDGAGMTRVITAAQFIKGNMPLGATYDAPQVTDDEAYHIAAYINSIDRPAKKNKEADFPDKKLKPVSTPYGPWMDGFPSTQHKYGPFPPIMAFYQEKYGITKTK